MQNRYAKLAAWVYNLDKPVGRSFGDIEYYRTRLAACAQGPILEPAVGNGRVLVPLLKDGFPIEGFDASQQMLDYCIEECSQRRLATDLKLGTFEGFTTEKRYAAIIIPAGSFQLITDTAAAMAALRRFHEHLLPNGRLILDIDPINGFLSERVYVRSWTPAEGELLTLTDTPVETDHIAQTSLSHLRYDHWRNGNLIASELDLFKLRWWGINELTLALQAAGFADMVVSGGYVHGRAPTKDDEAITIEACRSAKP